MNRKMWSNEEKVAIVLEILHQLDNGTFMKPGKTTLAEFLGKWLKDYAWPNLAPRTAEGYEHIIRRHLVPGLGNTALTQLKPEHLQRYYSERLVSGAPRGIRTHDPRFRRPMLCPLSYRRILHF